MSRAILVSGSSGLVGSRVCASLSDEGRRVVRLVRREPRDPHEVRWDPQGDRLDPEDLEGLDAVVHLAGENIAGGRWTATRKSRIVRSRVEGTALLARALASTRRPPGCLVSASAIGFYGDRGDAPLDEDASPGSGFLADTCRAWEAATAPARDAGIRVVLLRIGIVLDKAGGALPRMLPPFRLGLGGRLGSGRQYMSWVALGDLERAIRHALAETSLEGPVNAVAPGPVTNAAFTRALGRTLGRPALLPVPALAIRLVMGEMGRELLLSSARVIPTRLTQSGFSFDWPDLEPALRHVLGR